MGVISVDTNIWSIPDMISKADFLFQTSETFIMFEETLQDEELDTLDLIWGIRSGFVGVELTTEEFFFAQELAQLYVALSVEDRIALAIAKMRRVPLLTESFSLKDAAEHEGIQVIGISKLSGHSSEDDGLIGN